MGLRLPGGLEEAIGWIGYSWPPADETKLFELGQDWIGFAETIGRTLTAANPAAAGVWTDNKGLDIAAFQAAWQHEDGPASALGDGATAAILTGIGLMVCAAVVLALKIMVIVQLVLLLIEVAQAIATAAVSFGATLLEIPVFQQLTRAIVENLAMSAVFELIGG